MRANEFEFVFIGKNGIEIKCEIIVSFEMNKGKYVIFTDRTVDEKYIPRLYAAKCINVNGLLAFEEIQDDDCFNKCQKVLDFILDRNQEGKIDY